MRDLPTLPGPRACGAASSRACCGALGGLSAADAPRLAYRHASSRVAEAARGTLGATPAPSTIGDFRPLARRRVVLLHRRLREGGVVDRDLVDRRLGGVADAERADVAAERGGGRGREVAAAGDLGAVAVEAQRRAGAHEGPVHAA